MSKGRYLFPENNTSDVIQVQPCKLIAKLMNWISSLELPVVVFFCTCQNDTLLEWHFSFMCHSLIDEYLYTFNSYIFQGYQS